MHHVDADTDSIEIIESDAGMGLEVPDDDKEEIKEDRALVSGSQVPLTTEPEDIWFTGCTESISSLSFATLKEGVYLNDEVINTYIAMLNCWLKR